MQSETKLNKIDYAKTKKDTSYASSSRNYYHRSIPPGVLYEKDLFHTQQAYSDGHIYS